MACLTPSRPGTLPLFLVPARAPQLAVLPRTPRTHAHPPRCRGGGTYEEDQKSGREDVGHRFAEMAR